MSNIFTIKAQSIYDGLTSNQGLTAADLGTTPGPFLQFLEQLLTTLLPTLISCIPVAKPKGTDVATALANLSIIQRATMRRTVRHELANQDAVNSFALPVYLETLRVVTAVTADEAQQAIDQMPV